VIRAALEVGRHSPWLSRLLQELVPEVYVVNPHKVALVYAADNKCDKVDAEVLARLARIDATLLAPIQHRRKDTQASLAVLRARAAGVRSRTLLIHSVRGQVKAMGGGLRKCSAGTFHDLVEDIPEELEFALGPTCVRHPPVGGRCRPAHHQTLLGHQKLDTTSVYLAVRPEVLRQTRSPLDRPGCGARAHLPGPRRRAGGAVERSDPGGDRRHRDLPGPNGVYSPASVPRRLVTARARHRAWCISSTGEPPLEPPQALAEGATMAERLEDLLGFPVGRCPRCQGRLRRRPVEKVPVWEVWPGCWWNPC